MTETVNGDRQYTNPQTQGWLVYAIIIAPVGLKCEKTLIKSLLISYECFLEKWVIWKMHQLGLNHYILWNGFVAELFELNNKLWYCVTRHSLVFH